MLRVPCFTASRSSEAVSKKLPMDKDGLEEKILSFSKRLFVLGGQWNVGNWMDCLIRSWRLYCDLLRFLRKHFAIRRISASTAVDWKRLDAKPEAPPEAVFFFQKDILRLHRLWAKLFFRSSPKLCLFIGFGSCLRVEMFFLNIA